MSVTLVAILTVLVATALGLLSNIVANKIQPHIEKKTRLLIVLFCVLIVATIGIVIGTSRNSSEVEEKVLEKPPISDSVKITSIKTVEESQTHIQEIGDSGVISVYWELILSNIGESTLSIVSYDVKQTGQDFPAIMYSGMEQGLYIYDNGEFKPLDLPVELSAGNARKVFIRIGLLMTPEATRLIKENFSDKPTPTLKTISHFLFSSGIDFYGNKVEPLAGGIGYRWPSIDQVREQVFTISFKTARGASVVEQISWYKHGGNMDLRRYQ